MKKLYWYWIGGVILAIIAGFLVGQFSKAGIAFGDTSTGFPNGLTVGGGTYASSTLPALSVTGNMSITGTITSGSTTASSYFPGGLVQGGACAVSTASTTNVLQLTSANLACSLLSVTTGSTTGTLVVTLPASSTMLTVATSGDSVSMYIYAASTTGNSVQISASTTAGFALLSPVGVASTTAATTTIAAGNVGILDFVRLPTTNLTAIITPAK